MKSINHAINGLASSLLLNVGLTSAAEKFDTVSRGSFVHGAVASEGCGVPCNFALASEGCGVPCNFTVDAGQ